MTRDVGRCEGVRGGKEGEDENEGVEAGHWGLKRRTGEFKAKKENGNEEGGIVQI